MSDPIAEQANDIEKKCWIAVDTETTGTNPWKYELIEIGAVRFTLTDVLDTFQVLINPEKKQDPKSKAIHNITEEELNREAISLEEAMTRFMVFIKNDPLVFHNAPFDLGFLTIAMDKFNIKHPGNFYYDTLFLSRTYFPNLDSYALDSLRKSLNIDSGPSHRALSDSIATAHVFQNILQKNEVNITSNRKLKTFLRFHRKVDSFELKVPKELEEISNYFNKYIQTNSFLRVSFYDKNQKWTTKTVFPQDIMIFNQVIFLKVKSIGDNDQTLVKVKEAIFHDPDLGKLKF